MNTTLSPEPGTGKIPGKPKTGDQWFKPDIGAMEDHLRELFPPGEYRVEVRSLPEGKEEYALSMTGTPDEIPALARKAALWSKSGRNAFYCLNPVRPDYTDGKGHAVCDADITRRWRLLIDVDAIKDDPKAPATREQAEAALKGAMNVRDSLAMGFNLPEPLLIFSGNGGQLVYAVDMPNDDDTRKLFEATLKAVREIHPPELIKGNVDTSVGNASRLGRLPGTLNRKSRATEDLPNRAAALIAEPAGDLVAVTVDQLRDVIRCADEIRAEKEALVDKAFIWKATDSDQPKNGKPRATVTSAGEAYVRKALEGELAKIASEPAGTQHNRIRAAARAIGGFVHLDLVPRSEIETALVDAALKLGETEKRAKGVVAWGLASGVLAKRDLPTSLGTNHTTNPTNGIVRDGKGALGTVRDAKGALGDPARWGDLSDADIGMLDLSTVTPKKVEWLLKYRIPLGKFTLLAGEGGLGKTFLLLSIAAGISTGGDAPGGEGEKYPLGDVIILTAEDDPEDTLAPRLIAMGADLKRIVVLGTAKLPNGRMEPINLTDIDRLQDVLRRRPETKMIFVDPMPSFLGRGVDDGKNAELRTILGPLADFAKANGIAVVGVTHFNKAANAKAAQRVMGSVAYSNVARATWCLVEDPDDEARRLLLPVKNNLSPVRNNGLAFTIEEGIVVWDDEGVSTPINEVLGGVSGGVGAGAHRANAIAFLKELLTGKFVPSDEVKALASAKGFGKNLIWDVKDEAGVRPQKEGFGKAGVWKWTIDPPPKPEPTDEPKAPLPSLSAPNHPKAPEGSRPETSPDFGPLPPRVPTAPANPTQQWRWLYRLLMDRATPVSRIFRMAEEDGYSEAEIREAATDPIFYEEERDGVMHWMILEVANPRGGMGRDEPIPPSVRRVTPV